MKLQIGETKNIEIEDNGGSTCLIIKLYPGFINEYDDYKEGVTNVLLSFFGGILNHICEQRGYSLHTERRQSFGFLRPTLTDAGSLRMRLSLGLEPHQFDDIIVECLKEFNKLLSTFKFNDRSHESVKALFDTPAHLKRDSYLRNIVRKDDRTLRTFRQAKAYLDRGQLKYKSDYITHSMSDFLQEYVVNQKSIDTGKAPQPSHKVAVETCSSNIVVLLKRVVDYTIRFASDIKFIEQNDSLNGFVHSFWHLLQKLFNNCDKAKSLIENLDKLESTHFYAKASLLIENILEYLILIDGLLTLRHQNTNSNIDSINKLKNTEINYATSQLGMKKEQVNVFFTDSGQQAITTSLLVMSGMHHGELSDGKKIDHDVFLFDESYFEVKSFMEDIDFSLRCKTKHNAKILFIDFTKLNNLIFDEFKSLKTIIIDITHFPSLDNDLLKKVIVEAHKKDIWVVLVESNLKHKQLGIDKYQSGQIMTLAPRNKFLPPSAKDEFQTISDYAMHPAIASYFNIVNEICEEKEPVKRIETSTMDAAAIKVLPKLGIFASANALTQPDIINGALTQKHHNDQKSFMANCSSVLG